MSAKAANPAASAASVAPAEGAAPKKKGKLLPILLAVVVLGAGAGGGWWFFMGKKAAGGEHEEAAAPAEPKHAAPTYMALENMVVNLNEEGGERFVQVGITLELDSDKTVEKVKTYLPSIRSRVLMLVSQRTAAELLKRDGKEKLAADIQAEVSGALGYEAEPPAAKGKAADEEDDEAPRKKRKKAKAAPSPVQGVLFSAFIVQ